MNTYIAFGIIGIIGNFVAALADVPLVKPGKPDKAVAIAIATGALAVPKLCILLNPVVSALILLTLKKCGVKIIGTLGVGYMLYSILLIIAGLA